MSFWAFELISSSVFFHWFPHNIILNVKKYVTVSEAAILLPLSRDFFGFAHCKGKETHSSHVALQWSNFWMTEDKLKENLLRQGDDGCGAESGPPTQNLRAGFPRGHTNRVTSPAAPGHPTCPGRVAHPPHEAMPTTANAPRTDSWQLTKP